jgi:hypothetical protein
VRVALAGLRVAEVPSYEYPRLHGVSNLNAARDGMRVIRTMTAEWRGRRQEPMPLLMPARRQRVVAAPEELYAAPEEESVG